MNAMDATVVAAMRRAFVDLPTETSFGSTPALREVYLPRSHLKALHPDILVVSGMRGAGKTFWWSALQNPYVRVLVGEHVGQSTRGLRSALDRNSVVRAGFGERTAPNDYPGREVLSQLMSAGVEPRTIWRTVLAWHLLPVGEEDHPLQQCDSWEARSTYVARHPEATERLFRERDDELEWKGSYFLVLFDAVDRCTDEWRDVCRAIRGLLQVALELRSYRWLRAKVFLRSDQLDESRIADFPDASKVLSAAVELNWPRHELYGLLWHYLVNGESGDVFRELLDGNRWDSRVIDGQKLYAVPRRLIVDELTQREKFRVVAGPFMGSNRRRGVPYTWISSHLADTKGRVSPRSFIAALRTAALETENREPEHGYALGYESVKRGVREASRIRVREIQEDYPWVHEILGSLEGMVVPCGFEEIAERWRCAGVLERLTEDAGKDGLKFSPPHLEDGADGVRADLESLGMFLRMRDGRVNIPDVFRVGFGLGRRGGVSPAR